MSTKYLSGTYTSTVALSTFSGYSAFSVSGRITVAANVGIFGSNAKAWTLANSGLISGTSGIFLNSGGSASTITNTGTVVGTSTSGIGIALQSGGFVQNQGLIQGGIGANGAAGSIGNSG